jgi:hypothetical protein
VQPSIVIYTPSHLKKNGKNQSIHDENPTISLATIIGKMEPRTLKLIRSIKN